MRHRLRFPQAVPCSRYRSQSVLALAFCMILLSAQPGGSSGDPGERPQLVPDQPYSVEIVNERTQFVLPGPSDRRSKYFTLIISSLGRADLLNEISLNIQNLPDIQSGRLGQAQMVPLSRFIERRKKRDIQVEQAEFQTASRWDSAASFRRSSGITDRTPPARPRDRFFHSRLQINQLVPQQSDTSNGLPGRTDTTEFFIHTGTGRLADPASYSLITASTVAAGQRLLVMADRTTLDRPATTALAEWIVTELEHELMPRMEQLLGSCRDLDGSRHFTVLLTPLLDRLQGGQTQLKGFVRGSDFDPLGTRPFSHRRAMLYLNSNLKPSEELRAILAHEFTHAISMSQRGQRTTSINPHPPEEDWLNEAIAHLSENLFAGHWANLDHRVRDFLDNTAAYPLVVRDYYGSGQWRNHGCRGATYLFLRFCVDHYGTELLPTLIDSGHRGAGNLAKATGVPFTDLFRQWTIAMARQTRFLQDERLTSRQLRNDSPGSRYRTIRLDRTLGRFALNGPNVLELSRNSQPQVLRLRGTSTQISRLGIDRNTCIKVEASRGTRLQITVIPESYRSPGRDQNSKP